MFYYIPEQNPHIEKVNHNTITKHQDEFRKKKKTKTKNPIELGKRTSTRTDYTNKSHKIQPFKIHKTT